MESIEQVLQKRDKLSKKEAEEETSNIKMMIQDMLDNGDGYDEIEEKLMNDYGLEMDYIMDLI